MGAKEDIKEQPNPRNLSATAKRVLQCTCPVAASRKDFSAIPNSPHLRLGQWWVLKRRKYQIIFSEGKSSGPVSLLKFMSVDIHWLYRSPVELPILYTYLIMLTI